MMRNYCNEHPKQEIVGVCPLCLSHRLRLVLASNARRSSKFRLFAFPTSFFYRRSRHRLLSNSTPTSTSSLPGSDDSYISIKFGDNGEASWDKSGSRVSTISQQQQQQQRQQHDCSRAKVNNKTMNKKMINSKSVVEHAKPRPVSLRWRGRIAQLLQIIRWNKPGNSQVVQTVKMRNNRRAR
ncbi:hypothetical protein KSS87_019086, partial [Heliosperma pusillum]